MDTFYQVTREKTKEKQQNVSHSEGSLSGAEIKSASDQTILSTQKTSGSSTKSRSSVGRSSRSSSSTQYGSTEQKPTHADTSAQTSALTLVRKPECSFPSIRLVTEFKSSERRGAWYKYGNTATWAHRPGPPCLCDEMRGLCEHHAQGNPEKFSQARAVFNGGSNQEYEMRCKKRENSKEKENAWLRCGRERCQCETGSPCMGTQETGDIHTGNDIMNHVTCYNQTESHPQGGSHHPHRPTSCYYTGRHRRHHDDTYLCLFMKSNITKLLFCVLAVAVFIFMVRLAQRELEWEEIGIPNYGLQLRMKKYAQAQLDNIDHIIDSILYRHRSGIPSCADIMDHFLSLFDIFLCPRRSV